MASTTGGASTAYAAHRQWPVRAWIERIAVAERDRLALWLPITLGMGIAVWFLLPGPAEWLAFILAALALAAAGAMNWQGRAGRAALIGGLTISLGCALVWLRAERVAAPVLARPAVVAMEGRVVAVEPIPSRALVRIRLSPTTAGLPPRVRLNIPEASVPGGLAPGAVVRLHARMMPPMDAAVPGAYDFRRFAWFQRIGATGRAIGEVEVVSGVDGASTPRRRLTAHIQERLPGSIGGVASSLVTGDRGAISDEDDEALRRAGLTHLLSVSGLHVTAVVGATMLLVLRLLALSPWLALRAPLRLIAAAIAALAAIGYTLLAGAEVPTIRSCVAALLVLLALAMGREAITMRLVAAGAMVILLIWPEALTGPSFQLSFAAVASIIALHESRWAKGLLAAREEGAMARTGRVLLSLLLTGIVVEAALMPIVLFHFHKAGLYGAAANIVAIPLTTFVIMPLEALALLFDVAGLGAPLWWLAALALRSLLWIAHLVADAPGSMKAVPVMPDGAFALMVLGGLWLVLWQSRIRLAGVAPILAGALWTAATPPPDLLVTGDGRHVALRTAEGMALLRPRAGAYVRDMLGDNAGVDGGLADLTVMPAARCSADLCVADITGEGRTWRILATRSDYFVDIAQMAPLCAGVDIAISDRNLPRSCAPRWLKLDRSGLAQTGGLAITLAEPLVRTARRPGARHPWRSPPTIMPDRPVNR